MDRMISVPLPFVIALLLAMLLGLAIAQRESVGRSAIIFLFVCTVLMIIVGLRWTVDAAVFRFLQPVIASLLPPAAWFCFAGLRGEAAKRGVWPHLLPAAGIFLLSAFWPYLHPPIDAVLAVMFFGYGGVLLRLGLAGQDGLAGVRLSDVAQAGRATALVGGLLVFSGTVDLAITADFGMGGGSHAALIVSAANMVVLPVIAWSVVVMARSVPGADTTQAAENIPERREADPNDDHVLAEINRLMSERKFYRDPDLTLERLSRRLGIPARQVSKAINRRLGQNVSQAINAWRIGEAMELLAETDWPVTTIMFDCGFQTKSNFNREFLRVTGTSPSGWRSRARSVPVEQTEQLSGSRQLFS